MKRWQRWIQIFHSLRIPFRDRNAMHTWLNHNKIILPLLACHEVLRAEGIIRRFSAQEQNGSYICRSFIIRPCKLIYCEEHFLTLAKLIQFYFSIILYKIAEWLKTFSLKIEINYFFIGSSYGSYFCKNINYFLSLLL